MTALDKEHNRLYWCARKSKKLGPFATREEAEVAAQTLFPKRPVYRDCASIGYGMYGPHFDIRFVKDERNAS